MFNKLCIIGVGLIGGSIARAARENKLCTQVSAFGREQDLANLQQALALQVIDSYSLEMEEAVTDADCVIIATPVGAMPDILQQLAPYWSEHVLYMDAGSTKGSVVEALGIIFTTLPDNFVPAHPIAGEEKSGVDAALVDLFQQKRVILTPCAQTDKKFLQLAKQFWQGLGSSVSEMQVAQHDTVLAATSHLPHIMAFALVDLLGRKDEQEEIFKYAAGGFKDLTRIASSDPTMWQDICMANKQHIIPLIEQLCSELETVKHMLQDNQAQALHDTFTYARNARQRFLDQHNNMNQSITFTIQPGGHLQGQVRVPGDKSISHRSIMLGSLAEGVTHVSGFLEGDDALATLRAFQSMGVKIEGPENGKVTINGVGLDGLLAPKEPIYLGNSGTSMRLICGLLAGQKFDATLTGDKSLSGRPMRRVTDPLAKMGAVIESTENGTAPLTIRGQSNLQGIHYDMPIASAQVKSCLLLAGLYARGETSVTEPTPTRDHTERMLSGFSHPVKQDGNKVTISRQGKLVATDIDVPSDISSAAFFLVGASIAENSDLTLQHVGINPTRTGVINILQLMGANIELFNQRIVGGEPVADIRVRSAALKGIAIPEEFVALAIDEFPVLFVAAACADGTTTLTGAKELRVKESDRIQVMADGLQILGVDAQPTDDGMVINGGSIGGGTVVSHGDHRIAMAFSMAGLRTTAPIVIQDCENVNTSFPGFVSLTSGLGLNISSEEG
ncbi:cyclohexadieny/prephenate dehydrogenase/3-phosphoshikimate 1-carboxyvinyltransferase [Bathymodiolus japonicus methanotrophic gill symbiont]|uniref:bifunctional prephenate dehydrogenase/3-phosphoshikimate 1-carboxyvinyltransferase n=1 Tax=Bathymodiolus japonicus methanotrophic gill symbiont TaxID=113269 RepID=UPI001B436A00|nr:bifunctional prephenate dehydrogenase/3-phosphoshikimate 1-carboxyvinyltransferase [Bathymodiolus japonicus methanotrophic gill symbiont]GFO71962.1 cyclohexadieny/prephenate dehydrogenase/3-phosphoshikimate 1-carboxyvinyltransferase [Bathymodiolus japonicus methanotrophic gill symbiont]